MSGVPVRALCIRRNQRHAVDGEDAHIELTHPASFGLPDRLVVRDISVLGLSFEADAPDLNLHRFALLHEIVVHVEGREITGDLLIAHVSAEEDSLFVCGGRFHPATPADQRELEAVVASRQKRQLN